MAKKKRSYLCRKTKQTIQADITAIVATKAFFKKGLQIEISMGLREKMFIRLTHSLTIKDLAEAAALLVLQKKIRRSGGK